MAFAVLDLGGGASELGLVVGLYALADVSAVLFGGVLGDRLPGTVMLQGSAAAAAVARGSGAVADRWLVEHPAAGRPGHGQRLPGRVGQPELVGGHPATVPAELLQKAISWRRIAQNVSMILGNGIAGLLVVWVGSGGRSRSTRSRSPSPPRCSQQVRVAPVAAPSAQAGLWGDVAAGFREVMRHTWLWLLILQALLYHLFYGGAQTCSARSWSATASAAPRGGGRWPR